MIGREVELSRMEALIADVRTGRGGALVLLGEAGIGKTTLVAAASAMADGLHVVRVTGSQAEHDIPFAGLHAVLGPFATEDNLRTLPSVQRDGLLVALGLKDGSPPGPLVVGAATLGLLAAVDSLLVLVDDLQWLDAASRDAVTFAARRLEAERVAVIATFRTGDADGDGQDVVSGLPSMRLAGLADGAGLAPAVHPTVAERLRDATGGNPLAMLEMVAALTSGQADGSAPLPRTLPATNPEQVYAARLATLDDPGRWAARVVAVAGRAPLDVLARALGGGGLDEIEPLDRLGLCRVEEVVRWRHPLARSAAARGTGREVRAAHRAVADAWRGARVPARAWHLADAAEGPDEEATAALVEAAEAAEARDAGREAADAWERAAGLVPDDERRATMTERAARAALRSGATRRAAELLDEALLRQPGPEQAARLLWQRGHIQHSLGDPMRGLDLFLQAVDLTNDPDLRVWAAAEGVYAAMYAGRPDQASRMAALVRLHHCPERPVHAFIASHATGAAAALEGDRAGAHEHLEQARELVAGGVLEEEPELLLWAITIELFDPVDPRLTPPLVAAMARVRASGDLTWLPRVLHLAARRAEASGDWGLARTLTDECEVLSRASGQDTQLVEALGIGCQMDALVGDTARLERRLEELSTVASRTGADLLEAYEPWIRALAALTAGDLRTAIEQLRRTLGVSPENLPLLVDTLVRLGAAEEALALIANHPEAGADTLDVARALIDGNPPEALLRWPAAQRDRLLAAVERELVGERLRRMGRRVEAREQLRAAYDVFSEVGARPWAERAETELRATGATVRRREHGDHLTPSEERVARMAAEGLATKDVAAALFLSPKTVEFHLGNAYRKLGVRNRTALARAMGDPSAG